MEVKRKTVTSTAVKARYNNKVYEQISARVPKGMAEDFKKKCATNGISQAQVIKRAIEAFLNS